MSDMCGRNGESTNIVDTTIVGIMRRGIMSKTIREKSHAVGLGER